MVTSGVRVWNGQQVMTIRTAITADASSAAELFSTDPEWAAPLGEAQPRA
jgi:hypothetical protein